PAEAVSVRPGASNWRGLAFCFLVPLNPLFLPYGALLNAAFSPVATQLVSLSNLTLHNIEFVFFELSTTQLALKNTFLLGVAAATLGTLLAVVIAYLTTRRAVPRHRLLAFLATAPGAIPRLALRRPPFPAPSPPPLPP